VLFLSREPERALEECEQRGLAELGELVSLRTKLIGDSEGFWQRIGSGPADGLGKRG
jgi:hypothetical protein